MALAIGQGLLGLVVLTGLAWLLSERRQRPPWRLIGAAVLAQFVLGLVFLKLPGAREAFLHLNDVVEGLQRATQAGTGFVFGYLGGGPLPFQETRPGAAFVLAFQALPVILVISALSALLWHWGVLGAVIRAFAWLLRRGLDVGGPAGFAATASIFVGLTEGPILIRPVFGRLTRSDLFIVLTSNMATVAGSVMVLYATILGPVVPGALGHVLVASVMAVPASVMMALLMLPADRGRSPDYGPLPATDYAGSMDAVTRGAGQGLKLFLNVIAMLIVLVSLVALANELLELLPEVGGAPLTLQRMLGWLFAPLSWCLGVPWDEAATAGQLLGTKTVLNELIAYVDLAALPPDALSERSRIIMIYALCGFANLGSIGIMVGGLVILAPERREDIIQLGGRSIVSGTLATCMTGTVVGLILLL